MRTTVAGEVTRLASPRYGVHIIVEVRDASGVWRDLTNLGGTDFFVGFNWSSSVDAGVTTGTLTLRREAVAPGGQHISLAPGVGDSPANSGGPLIREDRLVRVKTATTVFNAAPVDADWLTVFDGKIDSVSSGGGGYNTGTSTLSATVSDRGQWLTQAFIETALPYGGQDGPNPGTLVETVMQQIITNNPVGGPSGDPPTLSVPVSPGWRIRQYEQSADTSVLEAIRTLALQIGGDVRYRWTGRHTPTLTFIQPPRVLTVVDHTFGPDDYIAVALYDRNGNDIRNFVKVKYVDAATNQTLTVTAEDTVSRAEHGKRFIEIQQDATSNIDTVAEATELAEVILSDLHEALADQEITLRYWPLVEIGDYYGFTPNGVQYNVSQTGAVVSWSHEISRTSTSTSERTTIRTRSRPVGAYTQWLVRATNPLANNAELTVVIPLALKDFREIRRNLTSVTYGWGDGELPERGLRIDVYDKTVTLPFTLDPWPDADDLPTDSLAPTAREYTIPYPALGKVSYVRFLPVATGNLAGTPSDVTLESGGEPPRLGPLTQSTSATANHVTITGLQIIDSRQLGGTLRAWVNRSTSADANPAGAPEGTVVLVGTPTTVTGVTQFDVGGTPTPLLADIRVRPGVGKRVFFEFINSQGVSSGVKDFTLTGVGGVIDDNGNIIDGSIKNALAFAATLEAPPEIVSSLPAGGGGRPNGTRVTLSTNKRQYVWNTPTNSWLDVVSPDNLSSVINANHIDANSIAAATVTASVVSAQLVAGKLVTTGTLATGLIMGEINSHGHPSGKAIVISGTLSGPSFSLNLGATGTQAVLTGGGLTVLADGTSTFGGVVTATGFVSGFIALGTYTGSSGVAAGISFRGTAISGVTGGSRGSIDATRTAFNISPGDEGQPISLNGDVQIGGTLSLGQGIENKPSVTGSRGGNEALAELLGALGALGIIINDTTV